MARILVIDDEASLRQTILVLLRARGFEALGVSSGEEALQQEAGCRPDVALVDLVLPGMSGIETIAQLRRADPALPCVVLTAHATLPSAVEAMRNGAYDYLAKPFDNDKLILTLERALEHRQLTARVSELEADASARSEFAGIIGKSAILREVLRRLAKVSSSDATVLITGESGTGKELAARSLHRGSPRATGPFVALNSGAIPASLAESELFGHVRGAFTDAKIERRGRFEQADGGTLFLDEVGDLSLDLQVKFLRALQEHEFYPVGADKPMRVNVRLVAATNRDLSKAVRTGSFREDLFWRLNVVQIHMPSLRQRLEDLPLLTGFLLEQINLLSRTSVVGVSSEVRSRFESYPWPGNVRELANVLRQSVLLAEGPVIQMGDLPEYLLSPDASTPLPVGSRETLEEVMAETEQRLIEATLERFRGNQSAAASALGIDRRTLYAKLKQYRTDGAEKK